MLESAVPSHVVAVSRSCRSLLVRCTAVALALVFATAPAQAQYVAAAWTTQTEGTVAGTSFTVTGFFDFFGLYSSDLTGPDYAVQEFTDAQLAEYSARDLWTVEFAAPITGLRLYANSWRGPWMLGGSPPSTYEFSSPFTILSGFTGATQLGNTLELPGTDFVDGVLEFTGSISSLTVGPLDSEVDGGQGLTFAAPLGTTVPVPVPEPATVWLLVLGAAGMARASAAGRVRARLSETVPSPVARRARTHHPESAAARRGLPMP